MYCIVWRHYNADGLTPYVISKFPDKEEVDAQHEEAREDEDAGQSAKAGQRFFLGPGKPGGAPMLVKASVD